jgi:hypothetical protein
VDPLTINIENVIHAFGYHLPHFAFDQAPMPSAKSLSVFPPEMPGKIQSLHAPLRTSPLDFREMRLAALILVALTILHAVGPSQALPTREQNALLEILEKWPPLASMPFSWNQRNISCVCMYALSGVQCSSGPEEHVLGVYVPFFACFNSHSPSPCSIVLFHGLTSAILYNQLL